MLPLLHAGHNVTWTAWYFEPSAIGLALVILGLYIYASSRSGPPETKRLLFFLAGWSIMILALISPLHNAADRMLSFHMLQHIALTTLGPPLILLGLPKEVAGGLLSVRLAGGPFRMATSAVFAGAFFIVNMWFWHIPPFYQAALDFTSIHAVMHVAFMASGLLYWWPVIQPAPGRQSLGEGGRLLYLFVSGFPMGLLALLLLSSSGVVYDYYEQGARLWGVSPLTDQQVAGIIMGSLGEAASFIAMSLLFFRFLDREETSSDATRAGRGSTGSA